MEKKDDSLPVQAEAEAFETAEKYNVIQTEVEPEKVEEGKCVPADLWRKNNKMLVSKDDYEDNELCTTDAVAVAESRGESKPEGRVDDSKPNLTEDATQVVKDDLKAGASGNTAEDDAEVHLETTGSHYGTASYPSPPVCNHVNQTEVKRDVSFHRRLNASSSEDEHFSGQEEVDRDEKCSEGIEKSKAPAIVEIGDVGQTLGDQSLTKCSTTALNSVAERTTSTISPKAAPPPVQKSLTESRQATAGTSGGSTRVADYDEEAMRLRAQMKTAALEQGSDSDEEDEEA